jgi:LAO/AO transport system kinase
MTCSGQTGDGLDDLWNRIGDHRSLMTATGEWEDRRRAQRLSWMWSMVEDRLLDSLRRDPAVLALLGAAEAEVLDGLTTPSAAAERLLEAFGG